MMGKTHVFSGMAAGAAALPLLPFEHPVHAAGFIAVSGAAAIMPDLDHHNSTLTNMWGPITRALHKALTILGRGHRGGTHDLLITPIAFAALAWLASMNQWTSLLMLTFVLGFGLRAAEFAIPGKTLEKGYLSLGVAAAGSAALVLLLDERLWWLPVALAIGAVMHILGDGVTKQGVPKPVTWMWGDRGTLFRGPMKTDEWYEHRVVAPAFLTLAAVFTVIGIPGGVGWDGAIDGIGSLLEDNTATANAHEEGA